MISAQQLEEFFTFLKFKSISAQAAHRSDMLECAVWLVGKLGHMGLKTSLEQTSGHPVVLARNETRSDRPTVLIYGHYDVQPPDPLALWNHPPFEPQLFDDIVTARGATDNKGQIISHVFGVEEQLAAGKDLPVNLIFLIEGEEEIGSPNLAKFLEINKERLACDVVVISDTGMMDRGIPTLTYALRGISCLDVRLIGPDKDLHSGIFGGAVANPARVLSKLLSTLHDEVGHVAVDGFYDSFLPLEEWERDAWKNLPFDDARLRQLSGVPELAPEKGYSAVECVWGRPTIEINGLTSGYQGEGSKTVLPSLASAKLSCRLVPDQDPQDIFEKVSAHLRKHCPPTVRMEIIEQHGGEAYLNNPTQGYGLAAQRALRKAFAKEDVALIREGGSIPIVADFKRILGVDTLLLGLAMPDCGAHSPNETFPLENLAAGIRLNRFLLAELAKPL